MRKLVICAGNKKGQHTKVVGFHHFVTLPASSALRILKLTLLCQAEFSRESSAHNHPDRRVRAGSPEQIRDAPLPMLNWNSMNFGFCATAPQAGRRGAFFADRKRIEQDALPQSVRWEDLAGCEALPPKQHKLGAECGTHRSEDAVISGLTWLMKQIVFHDGEH